MIVRNAFGRLDRGELANATIKDRAADCLVERLVAQDVADHYNTAVFARGVDQVADLLLGWGDRLLEEHVETGAKQCARGGVMDGVERGVEDSVSDGGVGGEGVEG